MERDHDCKIQQPGGEILGLKSELFISRNTVERYENSFMGFRNEVTRLDEMIAHHERIMPNWKREIETSLEKVNSVLNKVENRMEEFMIWINHIKESNLNEEIPVDIVNSLHEIIQDTSVTSSVESMRLQVEEISQEVFNYRSLTNQLRGMVLNLQDMLDEFPR